jgi:type I restriction enzyme S subunit
MKAVGNANRWQTKSLRDLATINYGRSPAAILAEDGLYPVVGTGGSERRGNDYLHEGESIILGRKGTIDRVYFATDKFWTIDTAYYLTDFTESVPRWLYYFLQTIDLRQMNEATGVPSLSRDLLYMIEIRTPPKTEQTKIAEILSTVDRAIEQTEALIAKQQRIKTGLMQDLLTRGIDEHGNLRSERTHQFKDSPLGRIPVEWDVTTLKSLSRGGAQNGFFKKPEIVGSGYKLINVSEIYQSFGIDTDRDSVGCVDATPSDLLKYGVMEGDLFFTRSSLVLEGIAHCNIIRTIKESTLFECHVMRIQPDKTKIVPEFLAIECQSHRSRLFLMSRAKHVTMTTVSQPELEELSIPVPSNPEEQQAIVDTMLSNDRAIRHNEVHRSKLWHIKTALMQDLLTGKKRVTPLLNDIMSSN